jgi:hypothetical protein
MCGFQLLYTSLANLESGKSDSRDQMQIGEGGTGSSELMELRKEGRKEAARP